MRVVIADLGSRHADTGIEIDAISDIHYGHPDHDPKIVAREIEWLQGADNRYAFLAGDMCETALRDSVGEVYTQTIPPQQQAEIVVSDFAPVKKKILGAVGGNHEARVFKLTGYDPAMLYAPQLGVPYQAEGMLLVVRFGAKRRTRNSGDAYDQASTYAIYVTHGWGAARTIGAKLKNVSELARVVTNADIYIAGHNHQPGYYPLDAFEITHGRSGIVARRRTQHFISLGSALDYAGYAQVKGMSPTTMAFPKICLLPYVSRKRDGDNALPIVRVTFDQMARAA